MVTSVRVLRTVIAGYRLNVAHNYQLLISGLQRAVFERVLRVQFVSHIAYI